MKARARTERRIMNQQIDQGNAFGASSAPPMNQGQSGNEGFTEHIKQGARDATQSAREAARNTASTVKTATVETIHELQEQGKNFADSRKNALGERIKGGSEALRGIADKLRGENDPNIARYAEIAAERLERAGEYVASRDFGAIYRDLEAAARRRPEVVFGGMFVAGLALARFMKASRQNSGGTRTSGEWERQRSTGWDSQPPSEKFEPAYSNETLGTPKVSMADVPANPQPAAVGTI
jgi:hypothetical protein